MSKTCSWLISGCIGIFGVPLALASPTPNEFEYCHAQAAAHLEHCLNDGGQGDTCWTLARNAKDACYADVFRRHAPLTAKERAERQAERQEMAKRKAEAMEQMRKEKEAASGNKR